MLILFVVHCIHSSTLRLLRFFPLPMAYTFLIFACFTRLFLLLPSSRGLYFFEIFLFHTPILAFFRLLWPRLFRILLVSQARSWRFPAFWA